MTVRVPSERASAPAEDVVPTLRFATGDLPAGERFPAWRACLAVFEYGATRDHPADEFEASLCAWFMGDIVVATSHLSRVGFRRTEDLIKADGIDAIHFALVTEGESRGRAGTRPFAIGAGQVVALDLARPFEGETGPRDGISLSIARSAAERASPFLPDFHGRVLDAVPGGLLADHMMALVRHIPAIRPPDLPIVVRATLALALGALASLGERPRSEPLQDSILADARRLIERQLGGDLSPARIASDLGVTRSSLYRSFEPLGGVAAFIQRRRLQVIRSLLADPNERRLIAELADTFGFVSPAHFATAFRKRYGVSPREFRQTRLGREAPAGDAAARYRDWMARLG